MNWKELSKDIGRVFRTWPLAVNLNVEDDQQRDYEWRLIAAFPDELWFSGLSIPYWFRLPKDHIRGYSEDARLYNDGNRHGIITLKFELQVWGEFIEFQPIRDLPPS